MINYSNNEIDPAQDAGYLNLLFNNTFNISSFLKVQGMYSSSNSLIRYEIPVELNADDDA